MRNSKQANKLLASVPSAVVCLDICFDTAGVITHDALIAEVAKLHIALQKGQQEAEELMLIGCYPDLQQRCQ